jgi:hypothetical protein
VVARTRGGCPSLLLRAFVQNRGSLGVAAGVAVSFYLGADASGRLLGTAHTTKAWLPGQFEAVELVYPGAEPGTALTFYVAVDGAAAGSEVTECLEDNNDALASSVVCPVPR